MKRVTLFFTLSLIFLFEGFAQEKPSSYMVTTDAGTQMEVFPDNDQPPQRGIDAALSLTTLFASNNNYNGNMFDIQVTGANHILITSFDINLRDTTIDVFVYYKLNTYVGSENTPADWTLAGSSTNVVGNGADVPTPLPIGNILLEAGNTYGFYITTTPVLNISTMYYTNGANVYSDANITLTTGAGMGGSNLFEGNFNPRTWNGTIYYTEVPPIPLSNWAIILGIFLIAAFTVYRIRKRRLA